MNLLRLLTVFVLSFCLLVCGCSIKQKKGEISVQQCKTFKKKFTKTVTLNYLLFTPENYSKDKDKKWPLILFLHGAGERGSNLDSVKIHGIPKIVENKKDFPFIVVSPQCPTGEWWSEDFLVEALNGLVDRIVRTYRVDKERVYVTGLSMGGFGTWALAIAYPEKFAAIAPVCGEGDPGKVYRIREIPAWVFHGKKDETVPIENSQVMVDALKKCQGNVKFTIYPEAGHDSWTETYDNPELYKWFLEHKKVHKKFLTIKPAQVTASSGDIYPAFDGDFGSRWESEWTDPQWIIIDLEEPTAINDIVIYWETAFTKKYEILSSPDKINWKPVYVENNSDGAVDEIKLDGKIKTRYLKFDLKKRGTQWGHSIWEIAISL
ncbi:MAG: discoidin domain-containing protein [Elusimicrobia bacterium]|nr:discoidin domain-containing protein [Elusimicrobiota bacterium]